MPNPPANTVKVVIGGNQFGGEEFAYGFQLDGSNIDGQLALTNLLGVVVGSLNGNFLTTDVKGIFHTSTVWHSVRLYLYKGGSQASLIAERTDLNVAGTGSSGPLPLQCAIVASLETGVPGRSNRGRSYLPTPSLQVMGANSQVTSTVCTVLANAYAAMLTGIKQSSNGANPVVASATKGAMTPLSNVRVDSAVDTQRRRRNKVVPAASVSKAI
jgi:hypothetical protein